MAGGFGQAYSRLILDYIFDSGALAQPTNVYVSLHSADPAETGANELVGNGYARVTVSAATGFDPATDATPAVSANTGTVTFPTATGSDWSAATHFGIWTASTSGTFIAGDSLTASKTVQVGDTASFAAGALTVSLD